MFDNRFLLIALLAFASVGFAQTQQYCLDNSSLVVNTSLRSDINGVIVVTNLSETIRCPYGCSNNTINDCNPDPTEPTIFSVAPALVLFFVAFLLLHISINLKSYKKLQFLFLGMSLLFMLGNVWYIQNQASRMIALSPEQNGVFLMFYIGMIAVLLIVIIYVVISFIQQIIENTERQKAGDIEI